MANQAKRKRENRTLTVDFNDEATYHRLCQDGQAFIEFVIAFIMSIGFQLNHKCSCPGGFRLTRHSHYVRVRIGGLTIWRIQCTACCVYCLTSLCASIPQDETFLCQESPSCHAWRFKFRTLCRIIQYLTYGGVSFGLFFWANLFGQISDTLPSPFARLFYRR